MDFLILGFGLAVGFAIGGIFTFYVDVRPLMKTIIEMKKQGFVIHEPMERPEPDLHPFIRED